MSESDERQFPTEEEDRFYEVAFRHGVAEGNRQYQLLLEKYKAMVAFHDAQVGTPCEQIRHAEQIESLQAENERLIFALERVKSNTMYGKNFPDLEDYKQAANRAHEIAKTALTNPPID